MGHSAAWVVRRRAAQRVSGEGQAEVLAQGPPLVRGAEQAAALQFGDHEVHEIGQAGGQPGRQDVEPVGAFVREPLFQRIDDLRGRADHGKVSTGAGNPLIKAAGW